MTTRVLLSAAHCALLATAVALLTGCSKGADDAAAGRGRQVAAVPVTLSSARLGPLDRTVAVTGTLFGDQETVIAAKVAGRVTAIAHDLGDRVEPGSVLVQVDPTDYALSLAQRQMALRETLAKLGLKHLPENRPATMPGTQPSLSGFLPGAGVLPGGAEFDADAVPTVVRARLQAANAQARYQRSKQLHEQKPPLISDQDIADALTEAQVAQSDYEVELLAAKSLLAAARSLQAEADLAQQRLADATVRAPQAPRAAEADGSQSVGSADSATGPAPTTNNFAVAARLVSVGEYVVEGTPLFRLVADDPIKFRAAVPQRYQAQVQVGQRVAVSVEAYPNAFAGRIARIGPQIDQTSRTFQIEVLIPNPRTSQVRLAPGGFARGQVTVGQDAAATFVPAAAVVTFAGVKKVFTVEDGKAVEHQVETGIEQGGYVHIAQGLSGAPAVVVSGTGKLASGVPVTVDASPTTRTAGQR